MIKDWKHIKTIVDGDEFRLNGLNIWDHKWRATGSKINVKDPLYGQDYGMPIYEIENKYLKVIFAAGEFSNTVWGIYIQSE